MVFVRSFRTFIGAKIRFLIKNYRIILSGIFALFVLASLAVGMFFWSPKFQNQLVERITNRLNATLETSVRFSKAAVDFRGNILLDDLLVSDHHNDSLLYAQRVRVDLDEFNRVLGDDFTFGEIIVEHPRIKIKTYVGEEDSNLDIFFQKIRANKKDRTPVEITIDNSRIIDGYLSFEQGKERNKVDLTNINAVLSDFYSAEKNLRLNLDQGTIQPEGLDEVIEFRLSLEKNDQWKIENLQLNYLSSTLKGTGVFSPKEKGFLKEATLTGDVFLAEFPGFKTVFNTTPLSVEWEAKQLDSLLLGSVLIKSKQTGFLLLPFSIPYIESSSRYLDFEDIKFQLSYQEAQAIFHPSIMRKDEILHLGGQSLQGSANVYYANNLVNGDISLSLDQGTVGSQFFLKKQEKSWDLSQKFELLAVNSGGFLGKNQLVIDDAKGELQAMIQKEKVTLQNLEAEVKSFQFNDHSFANTALTLINKNNQYLGSLEVNDDKLMGKLHFTRTLGSQPITEIEGDFDRLALSELGITPKAAAVDLSAGLQASIDARGPREITLADITFKNLHEEITFDDVIFSFSNLGTQKKITQFHSDAFQFEMAGEFAYVEVVPLVRKVAQEALVMQQSNEDKPAYFAFDMSINQDLLLALYPDLITPEDIELHGAFFGERRQSNFSLAWPYFSIDGVEFQGLELSADMKKKNNGMVFSAATIRKDNRSINDLVLNVDQASESLSGELSGRFDSTTDDGFYLQFNHFFLSQQSHLVLDEIMFQWGDNLWKQASDKAAEAVYLFDQKRWKFDQWKMQSGQQLLAFEGEFKNPTNFDVLLETKDVLLEKVLPVNDKFTIAGALNTNLQITRNLEEQSFSGAVEIGDLILNKVTMGDFELAVSGSPEIKTYQLTTQLNLDGKNQLMGKGTVYVSNQLPNLDIDLALNDFDLSFLSALGKDKMTDVTGYLSTDLNLWGPLNDMKLNGQGVVNNGGFYFPSINVRYAFDDNTPITFRDQQFLLDRASFVDAKSGTKAQVTGEMQHTNFNAWTLNLEVSSDRLLVYDKPQNPEALFYGQGFLDGKALFKGPTKALTLTVNGRTSEGTTMTIPWKEDKGISDTSFIDFIAKGSVLKEQVTTNISADDEAFRGFEMIFDLDVDNNALLEIVVDQTSGSTLGGRGAGNLLIESNLDGKFNIWGDFITADGVYNFKNLSLIDKKFQVQPGGTIVWDGDPLDAQLNIEAVYQVPGGANPALLVDNPNFNRKIPTNVTIQLAGNLLKPDDPIFDISFPNTTGVAVAEINYRLADQQRRQLQAISLLSQGLFISEVSVSLQGITNNLYEKASDVFSSILGTNEGKLNVGVNYLQGEENNVLDVQTEDRIGLSLSTQISDKILINGKIGVPIDGVEESVIVGDVQIDFILNDSGTLRAKVFNRENDFRYLGDEFGYTQGMGMTYQVDFDTFQQLLRKISKNAKASSVNTANRLPIEQGETKNEDD